MKKIGESDRLFDEDMKPADFTFDERVANVFDDMVSRSVPMYGETMSSALGLAKYFAEPGTSIYDIGCSTATLLLKCAEVFDEPSLSLIGVDASEPMLEQARKKIKESPFQEQIKLQQENIEERITIENASVVFMNYTLQFVRPLHRETLLKNIHKGMRSNSALILVEKVLGNDSLFNRTYIDLYYEYKSRVGYSDKEIQQKREALENVLIPYRLDENIDLLKRCGFESTDVFFKWYNWCGIIAVKS